MDKNSLNKKLNYLKSYMDVTKNAATLSAVDSNANVTSRNVATMFAELPKEDTIAVNRAIVEEYLLKLFGEDLVNSFREDMKHHILYSHDESSLMPYCVAISLYPYLLDGLKPLGGTSGPPKHSDSFIGGLTNLIFLIAGQFAGAVAVPETIPYLDHFLRVDYGEDYTEHLDDIVESFGNRRYTLRKKIEDLFQQFVYCVNQPAAARGYQSPFVNIAYFDRGYFNSIFKDFVFPDGDEANYESTVVLQKMFMKWFNKERTKEVITFPVETMNLLYDKDTKQFVDEDMADFTAEMWAEGHSFFLYNSDSADALSSCCFSGDQMCLSRSSDGVNYMTFKELYNSPYNITKRNFTVFHNGNWCQGKLVRLPAREMYHITTVNNKEIFVTDNHINPTYLGDKKTSDLTEDDYLMFNTGVLNAVHETDRDLTYEQGYLIGMYLGDGSMESEDSNNTTTVHLSLNEEKYKNSFEIIQRAVPYARVSLGRVYNNVYPVSIRNNEVAAFVRQFVCGKYSFEKELNPDCLLQSVEFRRGILDGYYETDGGNSNRIYTTSYKLVGQIELLCTSLGINTIVNVSDRTGDGLVIIRGEKFNRNYPVYCIRWYETYKRNQANIYKRKNNSIYFKIKSIEKCDYEDEYVYCFEMKNEEEPYFTLPNGIITHNCRLKSGIENNVFSYTLGAGGLRTGSKKVITLNLNRITQDWDRAGRKEPIEEYVGVIVKRVHKYLIAWNEWLKDLYKAGLLTVYSAGYIALEDQYLTVGINGGLEAAEYLGIETRADNPEYQKFMNDILTKIKNINLEDRTQEIKFNTEFVPAENASVKLYNWDKRDGYWVPTCRNLYNSYFFPVEDPTYNVLEKIRAHGRAFISNLDGGSAAHIGLDAHLSKQQYRLIMNYCAECGCSYLTWNIPNTICNDCDDIDKRYLKECPKCGSKNIDYATRIIGYLKRISNFSEARQKEAAKRFYAHGVGE